MTVPALLRGDDEAAGVEALAAELEELLTGVDLEIAGFAMGTRRSLSAVATLTHRLLARSYHASESQVSVC